MKKYENTHKQNKYIIFEDLPYCAKSKEVKRRKKKEVGKKFIHLSISL